MLELFWNQQKSNKAISWVEKYFVEWTNGYEKVIEKLQLLWKKIP